MIKFILGVPVVLGAAALLLFGAYAHPFAPYWPAALIVVWLAFQLMVPKWWIVGYVALIPGLDLAPFSGWFFFEDFDFITLCVLLVGYLKWWTSPVSFDSKPSSVGVIVLVLYAMTLLISALIGLTPFAPLDANAFSHYFSHYNALRLLKGPLVAMLLVPILYREACRDSQQLARSVAIGMCAGLAIAALSVVWERAAFLDLTNLSSDYRVTGLFSATHTGGAALDGYLALSIPFAVLAVLGAKRIPRLVIGGSLIMLGLYGVLMTFSRALYGAIGLSSVLQVVASTISPKGSKARTRISTFVAFPIIAALAYFSLQQVFGSSGYRGIAAVMGFFVSLFLLTATRFKLSWQGLVTLILLVIASFLIRSVLPKGAYLAYGFSLFVFALTYVSRSTGRQRYAWPAAIVLAFNAIAVASHWGGQGAIFYALLAVVLAGGIATINALTRQRLWDLNRESISVLSLLMVGLAISVVATNSYYAGARFSTTNKDWEDRKHHWMDVYQAMEPGPLHSIFGTGLGRMPETYFWRNRGADIPGTFAFDQEGGNQFLHISGPRYILGYGDPLRILQAVRVTSPLVNVTLDVRTTTTARLFVGLCVRHLIYASTCSAKYISLAPSPTWSPRRIELDMRQVLSFNPSVPKPIFLVLSTETQKSLIDIDNVALQGAYGTERIRNGDFSKGLDHWYFASDRFHLAWHAKNMFLHVMFEQGVLGLFLFCSILIIAFAKIVKSIIRGDRGTVALASAIGGFVIVGMFDSLLDVPRLALLFYLLVFSAVAFPSRILMSNLEASEDAGKIDRAGRSRKFQTPT